MGTFPAPRTSTHALQKKKRKKKRTSGNYWFSFGTELPDNGQTLPFETLCQPIVTFFFIHEINMSWKAGFYTAIAVQQGYKERARTDHVPDTFPTSSPVRPPAFRSEDPALSTVLVSTERQSVPMESIVSTGPTTDPADKRVTGACFAVTFGCRDSAHRDLAAKPQPCIFIRCHRSQLRSITSADRWMRAAPLASRPTLYGRFAGRDYLPVAAASVPAACDRSHHATVLKKKRDFSRITGTRFGYSRKGTKKKKKTPRGTTARTEERVDDGRKNYQSAILS